MLKAAFMVLKHVGLAPDLALLVSAWHPRRHTSGVILCHLDPLVHLILGALNNVLVVIVVEHKLTESANNFKYIRYTVGTALGPCGNAIIIA